MAASWRSAAATRIPNKAVISARVSSRPERSAAISLAVRSIELSLPSSESAMIR